MSQALQPDLLLKSVGASVSSNEGERLGNIVEITRDTAQKNIEYIIIKSGACFGPGERFFAIPASSTNIDITQTGKVILKISKDDLQFSEGISAGNCPKPNFKHGQSVYELYKYDSPSDSIHSTKTLK